MTALAIRKALVDEFPALMPREPAKVIALKIGATPRCIHGLRQGEHIPRADLMIALAREYPLIRRRLIELMDAEMGESGVDPQLVLDEIAKLVHRRVT